MDPATSDSMIDIEIEEPLVRETLMTIDSANLKEDIITLAGFFGILFLAALIGIFGPPSLVIVQTNHNISSLSGSEKITFESTAISSLNRFISLSLSLNPINNIETQTFGLNYRFDGKEDGITVKSIIRRVTDLKVGNEFHLELERVLDYNQIVLNIGLENADKLSSVTIRSVTGIPDYSTCQLYMRLIFAFFTLLFLVMLTLRLKELNYKHWHLEQQLTIPLLALNFLFCNPFYAIQVRYPSNGFITMDAIFYALFTSYLRFFILVLFDSLRYKNRKTDNCFFAPKVVFLVLQFLVIALRGVSDDYLTFGESLTGDDQMQKALNHMDSILYLLYFVWSIWSMISAAWQVDVTERYKFNMYLAVAGTTVVLLGLTQVVFKHMSAFESSSIPFVMSFAVQNVFALLMAYCHWPYEILHDQTYMDHTDGNIGDDSAKFYVESDNNDQNSCK